MQLCILVAADRIFALAHKCKSTPTKSARCNYQKSKWHKLNMHFATEQLANCILYFAIAKQSAKKIANCKTKSCKLAH